jgi:hypothetical protein
MVGLAGLPNPDRDGNKTAMCGLSVEVRGTRVFQMPVRREGRLPSWRRSCFQGRLLVQGQLAPDYLTDPLSIRAGARESKFATRGLAFGLPQGLSPLAPPGQIKKVPKKMTRGEHLACVLLLWVTSGWQRGTISVNTSNSPSQP